MAKSFSQLRKNKQQRLKELNEAVETETTASYKNKDDRYWKLTRDDAGNGSALIRFLDAPKEEDWAWVRYFDHGFQGPGGWYIEKSLTTLGKPDPVSEYNRTLWQSDIKANKDQARKQKRRLHYVSNILVVKDPKNPENDGKVFLFRYGKKIFEQLQVVMSPETDELTGETPEAINPFCMWEGANLKLRVRQADGYPNYDKSEFEDTSPIFEDAEDPRYEQLWESQHSLQALIAEDQFKSYEQLKARLDRVLGVGLPKTGSTGAATNAAAETAEEVEEAEEYDTDSEELSDDSTEEEGLEFLKQLAADS